MNPQLAYTITCGQASIAGTYGEDLFELVDFMRDMIDAIETGELPEDAEDADLIAATLENIGLKINEPIWLGIRSNSDEFDVALWEGCYVRVGQVNPRKEDQ